MFFLFLASTKKIILEDDEDVAVGAGAAHVARVRLHAVRGHARLAVGQQVACNGPVVLLLRKPPLARECVPRLNVK